MSISDSKLAAWLAMTCLIEASKTQSNGDLPTWAISDLGHLRIGPSFAPSFPCRPGDFGASTAEGYRNSASHRTRRISGLELGAAARQAEPSISLWGLGAVDRGLGADFHQFV